MEKYSKTIGLSALAWERLEQLKKLLDQRDLPSTIERLIIDRYEIQKLLKE